jgi:hypothetical protein
MLLLRRCDIPLHERLALDSDPGRGFPCSRECLTAPSMIAVFARPPTLRPSCGQVVCDAAELVGAADWHSAAPNRGRVVVDESDQPSRARPGC